MGPIIDAIVGWVISNILDKLFGKKTGKEILELNNRRLIELLNDKEREITQLQADKQNTEVEKLSIFEQIRTSGLSTEKLINQLIDNYNKPLSTIFICVYFQKVPDGTSYGKSEQFVFQELQRYNCKSLGGGIYLIPPRNVPQKIIDRNSLHEWFDTEILKGRYCKLKFLLLIDLREKAYWMNNLPYQPVNNATHKIHRNIGEVIPLEDLFDEERISQTTTVAKIISQGDIGWLARKYVSENDLAIIRLNQSSIESKLGNPKLQELALDNSRSKLTNVLNEFGITNSEAAAMSIISEARFWQREIR